MAKTRVCAGVALAIGLGMCATVSAHDYLFKDFAYGSPQKTYTQAKGFYDCTEYVGATAMCKDDVDFNGERFSLALYFSDAKLTTLSLVSTFDPDLYASAMQALRQAFTLVAMSDGKSRLDLLELAGQSSSKADVAAKVSSYENAGARSGDFTYTFFENVDGTRQYSSMNAMLAASAKNLRAAQLLLTGQGAEAGVVISFSFPNLEATTTKAAPP